MKPKERYYSVLRVLHCTVVLLCYTILGTRVYFTGCSVAIAEARGSQDLKRPRQNPRVA